jgi:hypothetical protein
LKIEKWGGKTAEVGSGSYVLHAILNPVCGNLAGRGGEPQEYTDRLAMFDLDMLTHYKNVTPVISDSITQYSAGYTEHSSIYLILLNRQIFSTNISIVTRHLAASRPRFRLVEYKSRRSKS